MKNYTVRVGKETDIEELVMLNAKWQLDRLDKKQKSAGFLSAAFSGDDFQTIIKSKEMVVASSNGKIAGYYLLNNYCPTGKYDEARRIVDLLRQKMVISNGSRIGIGAQALIDEKHQGKGLSRPMLRSLCLLVKAKYDYLYSSISKENSKALEIHSKEGWFSVYETATTHYVLLNPSTAA